MKIVQTANAPLPAGHYSQAYEHNGMIFVSGQLPIDKDANKCTGSAGEQALVALKNIEQILISAGSCKEKVLKATVYISDIHLWDEVNKVYSEFFEDHKPARAIVPTRELHYGFKVEIEAIAAL